MIGLRYKDMSGQLTKLCYKRHLMIEIMVESKKKIIIKRLMGKN